MSNTTPAILLGLSIVTASAIYTSPMVIDWLDDRNVISTTNGSVRLGKIYNEMLKISVEFKDAKTEKVLFSVDEQADKAYTAMKHNFDEVVDYKEKEDKKNKVEITTLETLAFKVPMVVKAKTYISYRAEYQPVFNITIDEREIPVGEGVNDALVKLQGHCDLMRDEFFKKHQMLKPI